MLVPPKASETGDETMEEKLAQVGARIDELVSKAHRAKQEVETKLDLLRQTKAVAQKRGEAALDELKTGLDKAWQDLNQAWEEVRRGSERAAGKFMTRENCTGPEEPVTTNVDKEQKNGGQ